MPPQTDDQSDTPAPTGGGVTPEQVAAAYGATSGPSEGGGEGVAATVPAADDATVDTATGEPDTGASEDADADDPEDRAAADGRTPGELLVALEAAEAQRDEYLDALQRSRAEFENFRRRSTREAAGAREAGVGDLVVRLLDVLDDLDRTAAVADKSDDDGLAGGVAAVHRKLGDALRAAGVERIDEEGVPFDATRHEAVQQVPADEPVEHPEVAAVLRPGYVHGDRCLRAAMVAVRQ